MDTRTEALIAECKRQEESCLYTSTALFAWEREARVLRVVFIVAPVILSAFAGLRIFSSNPPMDWIVAACAMLAGLFPAIFKALDLDVNIKSLSDNANRFKSLQDRFRQLSHVGPTSGADALEAAFEGLQTRLDDARSANPSVPERYFKMAQDKISKGHFDFSVDHANRASERRSE